VACLIVLVFATGVLAWGNDPLAQDADARLLAPAPGHLMGTDGFGRDVAARVAAGVRTTLAVAVLAGGLALITGVPAGLASGLIGGRTERTLSRGVDLILGFPSLLLALVVVIAIGPSVLSIALAVAIAYAPRLARSMAGAAAAAKSREHVLAARCLGASQLTIATRHVLPLLRGTLLAQLASLMSAAVVVEATLSFLGLGVPAPYPSLGRMLLEGSRQYFEAAPWVTVFPGLAIASCGVLFLLLSRALEAGRLGRS
jgi:peptide/nickel transport system permease protein